MTLKPAANLAQHIEHTLLKADATLRDIEQLCTEAVQHGFVAVCVNPIFLERARAFLEHSSVKLVTVIGFPLGATLPHVLAYEARAAVEAGAHEIDMVMPLGAALAGDWSRITDHVRAVREATPSCALKVILETGYLTAQQIERSAQAALLGSPHYLKTSTGFGPRGATVSDVTQLCALCPPSVAVKASGGIRTATDARALIAAGAARLGTSSGVAIVTEGAAATHKY